MHAMVEIFTDRIIFITIILAFIAPVSLFSLYHHVVSTKRVFRAPLLGGNETVKGRKTLIESFHPVLRDNYHRYRDTFFKVRQPYGDVLMLPMKYVEELKALPVNVLSFDVAVNERFLGQYTLFSHDFSGLHPNTVPKSLNNNLPRSLNILMKDIHEETGRAFQGIVGPCPEWTEVNMWQKMFPIIAQISGLVFIGKELCHDPEYLRCIIQFTSESFQAKDALFQWSPWLRPLVSKFIPEVHKLLETYKTMMRIMTPVVAARLAAIEAGNPSEDMATWNIMNSPSEKKTSVKVQAHTQLILSKAAIYSTSLTGSHFLYELASRPDYLRPLRDELDSVMSTETVPWLTKTTIPKLKLLDSFCKESQRMNPLGPTSFTRKALRDIVLHDGVIIPAGTHITCALAEILRDPEIYQNPNSFDGYRHLNLRSQSLEHENRHQFVCTSLDDMNFGHGSHACPGRFLVNNILKVVVTYVLQHYDIKMPEGKPMPGSVNMPSSFRPDMSQVLLLRTRRNL